MNLLGHNSPSPWSRRIKVRRLFWLLVQSTLFRWSPPSWYRWRNWCLRGFGAKVLDCPAAPARTSPTAKIYFPWNLTLKQGCLIGPECIVYNLDSITLHEGANVSRNVHLCAGSHDFSRWQMPLTSAPIEIGKNVWVATDCFIGPGVSIGDESVVGARSVVVKNLPPGMICVGNPCIPLKARPPITS